MGYTPADIKKYVELTLLTTTDPFRIEVLNTMISIVKGVSNEKSSTDT